MLCIHNMHNSMQLWIKVLIIVIIVANVNLSAGINNNVDDDGVDDIGSDTTDDCS